MLQYTYTALSCASSVNTKYVHCFLSIMSTRKRPSISLSFLIFSPFVCRDEDRLEALQAAIGHAITAAGSLVGEDQEQDEQHPENRPRSLLTLLPLPSLAAESTANNNNQDPTTKAGGRGEVEGEMEEGGGEVEAEVVVDRLQRRALRLEHLMTAKACVGADMAERLSPFLLSGCVDSSSTRNRKGRVCVFACYRLATTVVEKRLWGFSCGLVSVMDPADRLANEQTSVSVRRYNLGPLLAKPQLLRRCVCVCLCLASTALAG